MPVVTINDYNTPTRETSRLCPGIRTCWPGMTLDSFNPFIASDRAIAIRRTCTLGILTIHILDTAIGFYRAAFNLATPPSLLLSVIFTGFTAWCLHLIGNMSGEKRVLNRILNRWHFDVFLFGAFLTYLGLWILFIFGYFGLWRYVGGRAVASALWLTLDLLVFLAAWVSTWDGEGIRLPY